MRGLTGRALSGVASHGRALVHSDFATIFPKNHGLTKLVPRCILNPAFETWLMEIRDIPYALVRNPRAL